MRVHTVGLALVAAVSLVTVVTAREAQDVAKGSAAAPSDVTAVMVEVTIERYLGGKRLSSTPYSIAVNPGERGSSLRMGGDIPIPASTSPAAKGDVVAGKPTTGFGYRNIGTNIDVQASRPVDGRYNVTITIEESSVYPEDLAPSTTKTTGAPAFRSYRSVNALALRDGQSVEYTTATDRLTGEVQRVTAKISVIK